jgi:hypothetical protein
MNRQHDEIASSSAAESPAIHSTRAHAVSLKTFDLHMKRNANNASCGKNKCSHQLTYRAPRGGKGELGGGRGVITCAVLAGERRRLRSREACRGKTFCLGSWPAIRPVDSSSNIHVFGQAEELT